MACTYVYTAHVMIDQNWNNSLNYQMIQSVNVLKDMIDVRDCVKECAILNMDDVMNIINDICYLFNLTYMCFIVELFLMPCICVNKDIIIINKGAIHAYQLHM